MSRHAAIELDWADGTYTFRLGLDQLEELEAKCDLSIFVLARLLSPEVRAARSIVIRETLRIGLIGGGLPAVKALTLVRQYADETSLEVSRDVAYAVALAAIERVHGDQLGKPPDDQPGERPAAESSGSTSSPSGPEPS